MTMFESVSDLNDLEKEIVFALRNHEWELAAGRIQDLAENGVSISTKTLQIIGYYMSTSNRRRKPKKEMPKGQVSYIRRMMETRDLLRDVEKTPWGEKEQKIQELAENIELEPHQLKRRFAVLRRIDDEFKAGEDE